MLPFLRTHLPLLQREIHALARANKQVSGLVINRVEIRKSLILMSPHKYHTQAFLFVRHTYVTGVSAYPQLLKKIAFAKVLRFQENN